MQLICCEYGSSLLTLEADDDIVEELEDEAEPRSMPRRKGPVVSETTPSLDCEILCVAAAAKISLRNLWHTRVTLLPIFSPHTAKLIKECVCQLLQHSFRFVQLRCSLCFPTAAEKSV